MRRFYFHARDGIFYAELIDPKTGRKLTARSTGATDRDLIVGNFAKTGPSSELFLDFLDRIWVIDHSPFLSEKLRYGHSVTRRHALEQAGVVRRYWDRKEWASIQLVDVSQAELKVHLLRLRSEGLAPATLNKGLAAVGAPLVMR
jgi:hypothetical protein